MTPELLAHLRAGLSPDDPAYLWTYAERQPERAYLRVWGTTPPIATYSDMDHHGRFLLAYGPHNPNGTWCYALPAGVTVASEEPAGWTGWRADEPLRAWAETVRRLELERSTVEALGV